MTGIEVEILPLKDPLSDWRDARIGAEIAA